MSAQVLAQVLHDSRQQAAAISALVQVMDHGGSATRETLSHLSRAAVQLVQLLELLEHPVDRRPATQSISLWQAVEDIVATALLAAPVRVEVEADESAMVFAPLVLLRRATSNLINNAVRAAGDGGRVRFSIQRGATSSSIVVEDSGPGFGAAPKGRGSIGLGVVTEFLGSVHGTFEIRQSDLGGALLRLSIPDRLDEGRAEGGVREGLAV